MLRTDGRDQVPKQGDQLLGYYSNLMLDGFLSSVKFSCSAMSASLRPHNCSTPGLPVHHQLQELTQTPVHWGGDAIQPSHPLSSPSPPARHQGLFQWVSSASGGQSIGVSASTSILPMNSQDWSPFGWTGWISLQSKGLSRVFSNTTGQKSINSSAFSFIVQLSHPYMTTGKTTVLTRRTSVGKVTSLLLNMLSRLVIAFFFKEQAPFNFTAAVIICSGIGL